MTELRRRVQNLSPEQQALLAERLGLTTEGTSNGASEVSRLVAYVVARDATAEPPDPSELRAFLKDRLPDYMVPASFVVLDALPRTPNGKVDVRRLPRIEATGGGAMDAFVPPRGHTEMTLAQIWTELLGGVRVGVHDNFFEIGGDSILSIQVVARAAQAGLRIAPDQLFQHQTIAELASVVGSTPLVLPEQGSVSGDVPLTPIQHWFFEQPLPRPNHWHQALWLETTNDLGVELLEEAANHVIRHHDALRLRFLRDANGRRQLHGPTDARIRVRALDLSTLPSADQEQAMAAAADELARATNLAGDSLLSLMWVKRGADLPDRALVAIHHLIVDPISWQILIEDLERACRQLRTGVAVILPAKTSSFKDWAVALSHYATSARLSEQRGYWMQRSAETERIPRDEHGEFTEDSAATITVVLGPEETDSLLHQVPAAYGTRIDEVLLTALISAFAEWAGRSQLLVGLERHGREAMGDGIDLSRTVGWFTAYHPLWLSLEGSPNPGEALKSVKEQVRRAPGRGLGYGVLRYLSPDAEHRQALREQAQPELVFNYAGRVSATLPPAGSELRPLGLPFSSRDGANRRAHVLEINAVIEGGRLQVAWTYSSSIHRRETVARAAELYVHALQKLVAHCSSPDASGYTPSDFPEAGLDQEELDRFLGKLFS